MKYIICSDGKKYSRDSDNAYVAHCIKEESKNLNNTAPYSDFLSIIFILIPILIISLSLVFQFFKKKSINV